jgi:acyl carrier protein
MVTKALDWLYDYFSKKDAAPGRPRQELEGLDFFEAALIDSFGLIELITGIESEFNIELRPQDMQDKRFRSIKGLAQIIEEAKGK